MTKKKGNPPTCRFCPASEANHKCPVETMPGRWACVNCYRRYPEYLKTNPYKVGEYGCLCKRDEHERLLTQEENRKKRNNFLPNTRPNINKSNQMDDMSKLLDELKLKNSGLDENTIKKIKEALSTGKK